MNKYWESNLPERWVDLVCPKCGKRERTPLHPVDPHKAVEMRMDCPKCCDENTDIKFYDQDGKEINSERG